VAEAEEQIESFPGTTVELYRKLVRYAWEHASTPAMANVARVVLAEAHNFPKVARAHVERVIARIQRAYCLLLERGIQRGEFRPLVPAGHHGGALPCSPPKAPGPPPQTEARTLTDGPLASRTAAPRM
jgi:hypothetical protein